ncbi:MAG: M56 family metallopeptidase [Pseudomonadota bacterium]
MTGAEALLDAFINANILFLIGYGLWMLVRAAMRPFGLSQAFGVHLHLLHALFIAIVVAPLVVAGVRALQQAGLAQGMTVNLSDAVVAYYLNGGFEMKASEFEALVLMRDGFAFNLLNANGFLAQAVIAVFLAGVVIGLVRLTHSVICLYRIVANSYAWRGTRRIQIRLSDRTLVPFSTRGLWRYYVVIPSHMLGQGDELKVALAHEFQHIRQGDLEWEVALEALKPLFFFNPAYRAWKLQVEYLRELTCDKQVLSRGTIQVRSYCETLLSVCQKTLRRDRAFVMAVPKVTLVTADRVSRLRGGQSFLEQRITSAIEARQPRRQRLIFCALAVPLLAAMTLTGLAIQSPGDWSHDRLMLSTVVNLDRLDEINRLSAFGRVRN